MAAGKEFIDKLEQITGIYSDHALDDGFDYVSDDGNNEEHFQAVLKGTELAEKELWDNYEYFLKAVIPYAEKYGIKLALHPDNPPTNLGNVSRIMTSYENIDRAVNTIMPSKNLGVTMCQATYHIMGEDFMPSDI